jgi:hypothetical protein
VPVPCQERHGFQMSCHFLFKFVESSFNNFTIGEIQKDWHQPQVEQELLTLPEHLSSPSVFNRVRVTRSLVLCVMFCRLLFVHLSFFFWSLCCLSFFDLKILITPLVSSNSSYDNLDNSEQRAYL